MGGVVVDERIHRDHVVEAPRPGRACRRPRSRWRRSKARAIRLPAIATRFGETSTAVTAAPRSAASTAARRCRSRRRGGCVREGLRRPAEKRAPHVVRPARTVARMRPTGAFEVSRFTHRPRCGRSRSRPRGGALRRLPSTSVEPQEVEDLAVLHRSAVSGRAAQRAAARRRYWSSPPRAPGSIPSRRASTS